MRRPTVSKGQNQTEWSRLEGSQRRGPIVCSLNDLDWNKYNASASKLKTRGVEGSPRMLDWLAPSKQGQELTNALA